MSYVRSVHLKSNKDIFKVSELPLKEFAASLGLPGAPKVKFVKQGAASTNAKHPASPSAEDGNDESSDEEETKLPVNDKVCL